ncbi:hypothetical protein Trydic_g862 [Trypoxylus dichotomus]
MLKRSNAVNDDRHITTPIVSVIPNVEQPAKKALSETPSHTSISIQQSPPLGVMTRLTLSIRNYNFFNLRGARAHSWELQSMLPSNAASQNQKQDKKATCDDTGGVCLMTESPFRILRANGGLCSQHIAGDVPGSLPSLSVSVEAEWHRFPVGFFPSIPQETKVDVEKPFPLDISKGKVIAT